MALSGTAKFGIRITINNTKALDLDTAKDYLDLDLGASFTNGEGANNANVLFHDTRTLADGADDTLDLHTGTDDAGNIVDAFGDAVTIDKLKALYIKNSSTDANLLIGGAAATQLGLFNDVSDIAKLPPGGEFLFIAPDATGIDISTNECLKIAHDGTGESALTYDIVVLGVDAA